MQRPLSQTLTLIERSFCSSTTTSFGIKNVTKSNFDAALLDLRQHIRAADFVAIDLEMTGITSAPWREAFELDRFDIRYLKLKDSANKFAVVQLGVCPFRWDPNVSAFLAHPLVFFRFRISRNNVHCQNEFRIGFSQLIASVLSTSI